MTRNERFSLIIPEHPERWCFTPEKIARLQSTTDRINNAIDSLGEKFPAIADQLCRMLTLECDAERTRNSADGIAFLLNSLHIDGLTERFSRLAEGRDASGIVADKKAERFFYSIRTEQMKKFNQIPTKKQQIGTAP